MCSYGISDSYMHVLCIYRHNTGKYAFALKCIYCSYVCICMVHICMFTPVYVCMCICYTYMHICLYLYICVCRLSCPTTSASLPLLPIFFYPCLVSKFCAGHHASALSQFRLLSSRGLPSTLKQRCARPTMADLQLVPLESGPLLRTNARGL
jgi:hypothetical protein